MGQSMHEFTVPEWLKLLGTLLGGGFIAHLATIWKLKKDSEASFNERVDGRLKAILEDDEKTIARLERREAAHERKIQSLQRQVVHLQGYIGDLVDAMRRHGIVVPPPKEPPAAPPEDVQ
jgi:uncharacterized coiled-coil protein SlyX